MFIYAVIFEDAVYVGRTNDIERRMFEHGYPPFWAILETITKELVKQAEAKWAKYYIEQGVELLNKANNFEHGKLTHSEETKRLLSEQQLGKHKLGTASKLKLLWQDPTYRTMILASRPKQNKGQFKQGITSSRKGGHREDIPPEVRERMRLKAVLYNKEHGNPRQGVILSKEIRNRISETRKRTNARQRQAA